MMFKGLTLMLLLWILTACTTLDIDHWKPSTVIPRGETYDDAGHYRLGVGDILSLNVIQRPDLNAELTVLSSGLIQHPFFTIKASERTLPQLSQEIAQKLNPYVTKVKLALNLKSLLSYRVYIAGEVNKPGEYLLERPMWIGDAVALSGGLTRFSIRKFILIRDFKAGKQRYLILYDDLLQRRSELDQLYLERGDSLFFL